MNKIYLKRYAMLLWALSLLFIMFSTVSGVDFVKGADISWVPGQESTGIVFKDSSGKQRDIIDILKNDYQINTIRLRVFVNPSNDWGNGMCDIGSTVGMAKRAKTAGMQLMLSLHYSDSWADPSKQNPPAAWKNYTVTQLETAVYTHTKEVMTALSKEGIYPVYVQIGNETNNGMLWENGKASTATGMSNYARFVTAGNKAVKEISSASKTVVHISNG
ncbi:MAG: glycosyl hydrolase 53 family protein, partial [Fibrobacterota bacterium]